MAGRLQVFKGLMVYTLLAKLVKTVERAWEGHAAELFHSISTRTTPQDSKRQQDLQTRSNSRRPHCIRFKLPLFAEQLFCPSDHPLEDGKWNTKAIVLSVQALAQR
jgi:hypothetical protein